MQKGLKIPRTELHQPKAIENDNNLIFIRTLNANNPKTFNLVKSSVNAPVESNVNGLKDFIYKQNSWCIQMIRQWVPMLSAT